MNALPTPLDAGHALPIDPNDQDLDTPAMLVDLDIVEGNIHRMAAFASRNGMALRPHVKTHKSVAMARHQLDAGACGVTVATVGEAEVMLRGGIDDIMVAYPIVGRRKFDRLLPLLGLGTVTLVADSLEVVESYRDLASKSGTELRVMIEVDTGMHRVGVDPVTVPDLAKAIEDLTGLRFTGIMTHAGHAHDTSIQLGIEQVARDEANVMGAIREDLERSGFEGFCVSGGSTLTTLYLNSDDGFTEVRPGTYIYNDLRTLACWSCTADALAATMLSTVVSVNGPRVTIDAGTKTITTTTDPVYGKGHLVNRPDSSFTRLSEEHGVLDVPASDLKVGDRVQILPIHVCVWSDLQAEIYGSRGGQIVERIEVGAMRHSL